MPWKVTRVMDQRAQFAFNVRTAGMSVAEACREAGISRKTGYKWLKRFDEGGVEALGDESRAPLTSPHKTDEATEKYILELRRQHPQWGARKIRALLSHRHRDAHWPAASTIHDILQRHGMVEPRKAKRRVPPQHRTAPLAHATEPNEVWSVDYKGQFELGDGSMCYPLTITDNFSRMILGCHALTGTGQMMALGRMKETFEKWGLPRAIRSDNGIPFASMAPLGLSRLSAWWYQLGIQHERIEPGKPQQNGRHERMHLTLKQETARPGAANMQEQQKRFDKFLATFNHIRPHEALGQKPPVSAHIQSNNRLPEAAAPLTYPDCDFSKTVLARGDISIRKTRIFITEALAGQKVGLLEIDDGVWLVRFATLEVGLFEVGETRLTPMEKGKIARRARF